MVVLVCKNAFPSQFVYVYLKLAALLSYIQSGWCVCVTDSELLEEGMCIHFPVFVVYSTCLCETESAIAA